MAAMAGYRAWWQRWRMVAEGQVKWGLLLQHGQDDQDALSLGEHSHNMLKMIKLS